MNRLPMERRKVEKHRCLALALAAFLLADTFCYLSCAAAAADSATTAKPPATQTSLRPFDPADPPLGAFIDEWYTVLMHGRKSGQMHTRIDRIANPDGDRIVTQTKMRMRVLRAGIEIAVATYSKTTETLDGQPLFFRRETYLGQQPVILEGTIADGRVSITSSQLGQQLPARSYDLPDGAMMDWAVYREQFDRGLEPGTRYTLDLYEPSISPNRLCPTDMEILEPETVDLFGRQVEAVKTRQVIHIPRGPDGQVNQKTTAWVTPDGHTVRFEMSVMDIDVEVIACPKSIAIAPDEPAELLLDMFIPLNRALDADRLEQVTYRVRFTGDPEESPLADLPETSIQKITERGQNVILVQVTRPSALAQPPAATPLSEDERTRYLSASSVLNYRDPRVAELVEQAAGDETDPRRLAERLMRFVDRYIDAKSLDVGFATASEIARSRQGDCTEHGVLLAALGRAKGIPSRLVTGLIYADEFAGQRGIFAGHLWTQFWIDGRWVDLDATRPGMDLDPIYIALAFSAADDTGFADLIASTWLNIARLKIEVVATKPE